MALLGTISDIESTISALYPSKTRLHNPYDFLDNSEAFVRDGFGIVIGSGTQSGLQTFDSSYDDINIGIILTKEFYASDHDPDAINTVISSIYDETRVIRKEILNNCPSDAVKVNYSDTTGIDINEKIASITINFTMTFITTL